MSNFEKNDGLLPTPQHIERRPTWHSQRKVKNQDILHPTKGTLWGFRRNQLSPTSKASFYTHRSTDEQ